MRKFAVPVVLLAATSIWCVLAPATSATHVQCGADITQSTTLDTDLFNCPPPHAIRIGVPGVTLDLGGHIVDGTGEGRGVVSRSENAAGATVLNGIVREFQYGVHFSGADSQTVRNIEATDNFTGVVMLNGTRALIEGITTTRNTATSINLGDQIQPIVRRNEMFGNGGGIGGGLIVEGKLKNNRIHDNGSGIGWTSFREGRIVNNDIKRNDRYGIYMEDWSDNNMLLNNVLIGNGIDGIFIDQFTSPGNLIEGNVAIGNGDDGIDVDETGSTLTRNRATYNDDLGIETVPGTIDGGGNKARWNGNPAQCTGVTCN